MNMNEYEFNGRFIFLVQGTGAWSAKLNAYL